MRVLLSFVRYSRQLGRAWSSLPHYRGRQLSVHNARNMFERGPTVHCVARSLATSSSDSDGAIVVRSIWGEMETPPNTSYGKILLDRFSRKPDGVAMINGLTGQKYSHFEVRDTVIRLANSLTKQGIGKGTIVSFCAPNSVEVALLILATSLIGAVYNPISAMLKPSEMEALVAVSSPDYLVTSGNLLERFTSVEHKFKQIFTIDEVDGYMPFSSLVAQGNLGEVPDPDTSADDPVCIPYSSGTTGLPKGVVLSNGSIVSQMLSLRIPECNVVKEGDTTILAFPLFHIGGINILLNALYSYCTIILFPGFDFQKYLESIQAYKVTQAAVPPPVNVRLLKDPLVDEYDLSSLKVVLCGAAAVGADVQQGVKERLKLDTFRQAYGMTEVGGVSHVDDKDNIMIGSAGKILPFMKCKIVDPDTGKDLPPTSVGEIWMKGTGVMHGYLNAPDETKKCLTDDGWIKTGDIGYHSNQGHIFIVDRIKDLIKYKGLQVAPAELEAVLLTHPSVSEAAVIGIPEEKVGELPKAFIVLKPGTDQENLKENIMGFVKDRVAKHKELRGGITFTDNIPKLASGKILKRFLRQSEQK